METLLLSIGKYFFENINIFFTLFTFFYGVLILFLHNKSCPNLLTLSLVCSLVGIYLSINGIILIGVIFLILSISLLCITNLNLNFKTDFNELHRYIYIFSIIAIALGIYFRFSSLETIPNTFEGELAPYMAGATSLKGMFLANKGVDGPWAPLGILYYLPIYISYQIFGTTLYAVRFSSALVGLLTIFVLLFTTKKLFNYKVALITGILFSLNYLHIGWDRTDVHPHGVTAWPGLLICLATFNYFQNRNLINSAVLIFLMGLCWNQYPSGQTQVIIPIITFLILSLKSKVKIYDYKIITTLVLGCCCWYFSLIASYFLADGSIELLNPFTLTTQRTSWGNTSEHLSLMDKIFFLASTWIIHFKDVVLGLIYKAPFLHHQDFVALYPFYQPRTYPFLLIPFFLLGLIALFKNLKNTSSNVIIAFLISSILPGILSESPVPKRLSVFYLVADLISAIGIYYFISLTLPDVKKYKLVTLIITLSTSLFFVSALWYYCFFSGNIFNKGIPIEVLHAEKIESLIKPNALIIADINKDYNEGEFGLLLLDALSNRQNQPTFISFSNSSTRIFEYTKNPYLAYLNSLQPPNHWFYKWTKFRDIPFNEYMDTKWSRFIFIIQDKSAIEDINLYFDKIKIIKQNCINVLNGNITEIKLDKGPSFQDEMTVLVCDTK
jgi:hypothetical protein